MAKQRVDSSQSTGERAPQEVEVPRGGTSGVTRRIWQSSPFSTLALLLLVVAITVWADMATDPDFFLPDPFRGLIIVLVVAFAGVGFIPSRKIRASAKMVLFTLPFLILVSEVRLAASDRAAAHHIMRVDDALLRYQYRPHATVPGPAPNRKDMSGPERMNSYGLWDIEHEIEKPEGVTRVVVLGDSVPNDPTIPFVDRFPRAMERLLNERAPAGQRVEVINVSCEGYSTLQEVRLFEEVGAQYNPDVVVIAYVLNDPSLQDGSYRRIGNSFSLFTMVPFAHVLMGGSTCALFEDLHDGYGFDLVVRYSFERLRLHAEQAGFHVLTAALPIVESFDDPVCMRSYDKVLTTAAQQGFATTRVVDAFAGKDFRDFLKKGNRFDITHPNREGHAIVASHLARELEKHLWAQ